MRCSTTQHKAYGGMDRPARRLDVGLLSQDGASLLQRNMHTRPERFLKALAPSRAELGVAVAWRFPWTWRADLCARAAMPFLLGHALSRTAMHGGQATNDTLDAQTMAVGLRGGRWPQASVSPAERRATRALLRRRRPLSRTRAEWLAPIPHTTRPDTRPERGQKRAYTAHRPGGAERVPAPAGPQSMAVARALSGDSAPRLREVACPRLTAAPQHEAQPLSGLPTVPGLGHSLRLVLW